MKVKLNKKLIFQRLFVENVKKLIKEVHMNIVFSDVINVKLIYALYAKISMKQLIILLIMMIKIFYVKYIMKSFHHIVIHAKKIYVCFVQSIMNIK